MSYCVSNGEKLYYFVVPMNLYCRW